MTRCAWCCDGGIVQRYHDGEWGVPLHDDRTHFEYLLMEAMQCGLNWTMMLKKREIFRTCFADFDYDRIADFTEDDIAAILATPGMIRSRRKIEAVIGNARGFQAIRRDYGSFDRYLWAFADGKMHRYARHFSGAPEVTNPMSDRISRDLKRYGFRYLGSITVFSHLQACGIINDHQPDCFRCPQVRALAAEDYVDE